MSLVPFKKIKNKINYTVSVSHNQIYIVSVSHQHFAQSDGLMV